MLQKQIGKSYLSVGSFLKVNMYIYRDGKNLVTGTYSVKCT